MSRPRGIRIVAPFRPFPPEAEHHELFADFDWMEAIRMMSASAARVCRCPVHVITDVDTTLPMPALHYVTTRRRLMLWYLEIAACYLESPDFDRDTVMLDSDQLVYLDLSRWFTPGVDLSLLLRRHLPKGDASSFPILNGVQFWSHRAKPRLARFFRHVLAIAETLSEEQLVWGADTTALVRVLAPLDIGLCQREEMTVRMLDAKDVLRVLSSSDIDAIHAGRAGSITARAAVLDFRYRRKPFMKPVFEATVAPFLRMVRA